MKFLIKMLTLITKMLTLITKALIKLTSFLSEKFLSATILKKISIVYDSSLDCHIVKLENDFNLSGKELLKSIWKTLKDIPEWKNIPKKIILIGLHNSEENRTYFIHKNVLIEEDTTFDNYYDLVENVLENLEEIDQTTNYDQIQINIWQVKVRTTTNKNLGKRMYHTSSPVASKISCKAISPLKISSKIKLGIICSLDVETISINKIQIPVAISFAYIF